MAKKILIADDEPGILKVIRFRLSKAGYELIMVVDGEKALEQVKEKKPDLVLLDLRMPLMDGFEVCKRIKADASLKHIPVILVTASIESADEAALSKVHADGRIIKPFKPEELLAKVKKFIG